MVNKYISNYIYSEKSTMFEAAFIIIIIVLVYFFYSKHIVPHMQTKAADCQYQPHMHSHVRAPLRMQVASNIGPSVNHNKVRGQDQSRRTTDDPYGVDPNELVAEFMHDKQQHERAAASHPDSGNYHEYMVSTGLEASVVKSHNDFTDEIQNKTTGASTETVFSHDDAIVPSWGLRRRSAAVPINPNSKDVPSQTNEQLEKNGSTFKYGLF
jgi:hypothetical protein